MALTPSFTISQSALDCGLVIPNDTSTGSDVAVTQRRVYFQKADGTYLVEDGVTTDYNAWSYAVNPITLDILGQDEAANVTVQWLNVSNTVLYTLTQQYCFSYYNKQFLYDLVQMQALRPSVVQDSNYNSNVATFWTTIIGADNAILIGNDVAASQASLDRGTAMRLNQSKYF